MIVSVHTSDITQLILNDHDSFRRGFAELDDLSVANDTAELTKAWDPLVTLLDVHAIAEEEIFYPHLLSEARGAEDETLDAIGDHNDIRDGVRDAARNIVGSTPWWDAVRRSRIANDDHMAEEEREGIPHFRRTASAALRQELGQRFAEFKRAHPGTEGLDTRDKDPQEYVESAERDWGVADTHGPPASPPDPSLRIGSLKGR